jgi:two-component system sensor histidine kinase CiaH
MQIPEHAIYMKNVQKFRPVSTGQSLRTIQIDGHFYRILELPLEKDHKGQGKGNTDQIFQLVYNLQPEKEMLRHLLMVTGFEGIVSSVAAVVAGIYLANKALIPIQLAWKKQQQFVADASHELRTPLAVIKLHLERLFRHPNHTIEQESEHISEVIRETSRMIKMVSDLLTLARSDSNQLQILCQEIRLDKILERVTQQFKEVAMVKQIEFNTSISSPITMVGDEERLHQLFVILLDNAFKYNKEKGTVRVVCLKKASQAQIEIKDTGIGIAKNDIPYIFDRFFRGDKARTRTHEGTGLGLSIAKWIVEAHKGKIYVESELGVGTRFIIHLPIKEKKGAN